MKTVLVTGFGPYGNTPVNPSNLSAKALDGITIAGARVVGREAPSYWFTCIDSVVQAIAEVKPCLVFMLGEFGGRSMITVERIAQNFNDSSRYNLRDNAGKVLQGEPVVPGGPAAHSSTLPLRAMVLAMRRAGFPADISDAPGTLMCNHLMYGVLHHIAANGLPIRAGWVHLPSLPEVAAMDQFLGNPSMSLETVVGGLKVSIQAALEHEKDVDAPVLSRWQL
ncbi:pyroglutamyl-peptidase I [Desulfovibrio sp. JY]|nr:pyroglutamyl-peptidase I [Desulfovibrio sp. JY]